MAQTFESWRSGGIGTGAYILQSRTASEIPLITRGVSAQTANLFEAQNSAGTSVFSIDNSGNITFSGTGTIAINQTITGSLTVNGNTTLGNASSDTLTVTATSTFQNPVTMSSTLAVTGITTTQSLISTPHLVLRRRGSDPSTIGTAGRLYTKQGDTDTTELFYLDAAGNIIQITDAGALEGSSLFWDNDEYIRMGNTAASPRIRLGWNTTQTVDGLFLGLFDAENTFIIAENGDRGYDFGHGVQTNPTLFIQSAAQSATEFVKLNAGDLSFGLGIAVIVTDYSIGRDADGTNQLHFNVPTGASFEWSVNDTAELVLNATNLQAGTNDGLALGVSGTAFADLFLASGAVINFAAGNYTITHSAGALALANVATSGGAVAFTLTPGAHTAVLAEVIDFSLPAHTMTTTGAITTQRHTVFGIPTITSATAQTTTTAATVAISSTPNPTGAGPQTITNAFGLMLGTALATVPAYSASAATTISDASMLYIAGAPATGGNVTVTRGYAIWSDSGANRFDGAILGGTMLTSSGANYLMELQGSVAGGTGLLSSIKNTSTTGYAYSASFNDAGSYAGMFCYGSAYVAITGLATHGANVASNGLFFMTDGAVANGGTNSITFMTGGYTVATQTRFVLDATGDIIFTPGASTTGAPTIFTITAPAHTGMTTGTEVTDINWNLARTVTWAGATGFTTQRVVRWQAPTFAFTTVGTSTITNGIMFSVSGAPSAGSNCEIRNAVALNVGGASNQNAANAGFSYSAILGFEHTVTFNLGQTQITSACGAAMLRVNALTLANSVGAHIVNTAASVYIEGAVTAGTNMTITNNYAIFSDSGTNRFDGQILTGDKVIFTQTDGNEYIDSLADGYVDYSVTTAHRFNMSTADTDVRLEFVGTTSSGLLEWMEDEDTFRFGDDVQVANGFGVVIGHTAQITLDPVAATELEVLGTGFGDSSAIFGRWSANAFSGQVNFVKSRSATIGSFVASIVSDNDEVGAISAFPDDGVDYGTEAARYVFEVDDASPAAGDIGMAHVWYSMAGGGASITEKMRLSAGGSLVISKASAGEALDLNYSATTYTTALGIADIVRSGNLTGVDTQSIVDLNILPSFTLTEPAGGSVNYYGANIDLSGILVTAGVGTSVIAALRLVANADADVGTNLALFVDVGTSRIDGDLDLDSGTGLIRHNVTAGITASTTQTQGNGALTAEVNEVSVCANINDTVTLPSAVAGYRIVIINNGAQTLKIFPASGDNLGTGVDTAITLASGSNVVYQAFDVTNWESI